MKFQFSLIKSLKQSKFHRMKQESIFSSLGYVTDRELRSLPERDVLYVHSSIVCERLRGMDQVEDVVLRNVRVRLEKVLFDAERQRRSKMSVWCSRVSMTVKEVRILFGDARDLPVRALKKSARDEAACRRNFMGSKRSAMAS